MKIGAAKYEGTTHESSHALYNRLRKEASRRVISVSDAEFTKDLVRGLLVHEARSGYGACPCRLAAGKGRRP
jgi:ferredoxin-thioredoxin reductase catalytic subunit